jgi:hypothetical protein
MQPNAKIGAGKKLGLMMTKIGEAITAKPKPEILCSAEPAMTTMMAIINKEGSMSMNGLYRENIFVKPCVSSHASKGLYQKHCKASKY